ncbi:MAG: NADH-quinone oxidoreductase subunit C [Nitrospinota bacterium]|nr:MAG: NADH-quinone oxidoreductase subunit C [Nitrospinota bacterium]
MTSEEIFARLRERFADKIVEWNGEVLDPYVKLVPEAIAEVAQFLRDDEALRFDALMCLSGVDYKDDLGVVYHLNSTVFRHKITLKVDLPRDNPVLPSVAHVWRTADWHEREAYDLFGIVFENHPDLRRILLPDDWEGHPLRKDYVVQEYWHGMRVPFPDFDPDRGHYIFEPMPREGEES